MFKENTYFECDYYKFEQLAKKTISNVPDDYQVACEQEVNSGTFLKVPYDASEKLSKWDLEDIEKGNWSFNIHLITHILACSGKLPNKKGTLLIEVAW